MWNKDEVYIERARNSAELFTDFTRLFRRDLKVLAPQVLLYAGLFMVLCTLFRQYYWPVMNERLDHVFFSDKHHYVVPEWVEKVLPSVLLLTLLYVVMRIVLNWITLSYYQCALKEGVNTQHLQRRFKDVVKSQFMLGVLELLFWLSFTFLFLQSYSFFSGVLNANILWNLAMFTFLGFFMFPARQFFANLYYIKAFDAEQPGSLLKKAFALNKKEFWNSWGRVFLIWCAIWVAYWYGNLIFATLFWTLDFLEQDPEKGFWLYFNTSISFLFEFFFYFMGAFFYLFLGLNYFNMRETKTGKGLANRIKAIGQG